MGASGDDEYLTLAEASARYHVGVSTLWGWLHRGLLTKYRKPLDKRVYVCVREIDALRNAKPTAVEKKEHE